MEKIRRGKPYGEGSAKVTVQAKLEDGTILMAQVAGYFEAVIYVEKLFKDFVDKYITSEITEYQKMEGCVCYIQALYDYEYYQSSWMHMAIFGGGNCMASHYFMECLAWHMGLKAVDCGDFDCHEMTIVQVEDKNYPMTIGSEGKN